MALDVLITVGVWLEVFIGGFVAIITWKHYRLNNREKKASARFELCDACGFNLARSGKCLVCDANYEV